MEKDVVVGKNERAKKYREMNKEKEKERRNRWMVAHPEKRKEYRENLKKNNPEAYYKKTRNKQMQKVVDCLGNM